MPVPITKRILPKGSKYGRPGYALKAPWSVTVHNTANPNATAEDHAKYLAGGHSISWHFTVDHDSAVQHIPVGEQAWHTGTAAGNTTSVGVEVCEFDNALKQKTAENNAAWLVAKLHADKKVRPVRDKTIRTHKSWSGKNCPRDILPHWSAFCARVSDYYEAMTEEDDYVKDIAVQVAVAPGKFEALKKYLVENGIYATATRWGSDGKPIAVAVNPVPFRVK